MPSLADLAWAAGYYEGEGTIWATKERSPRMSLSSVDPEPVFVFRSIVGGRVIFTDYPVKANPRAQPQWRWQIHAWRDVLPLCDLLRPYLSPTRCEQMDRWLAFRPLVPRGVRNCPPEPIPSNSGYKKHRRLHESPCAVCLASVRLYVKGRDRRRSSKNTD
jgi:hypothetical protein